MDFSHDLDLADRPEVHAFATGVMIRSKKKIIPMKIKASGTLEDPFSPCKIAEDIIDHVYDFKSPSQVLALSARNELTLFQIDTKAK